MNPKVYVESSVVSYLANRDSRDVVVLAQQQITRDWWLDTAQAFEIFVSDLVIAEIGRGDPAAAAARLQAMRDIAVLEIDSETRGLASRLLQSAALPQNAEVDALHIAVAAINGMEFLLTLNCTHIANARTRDIITRVCRAGGFEPPVICTPAELNER